ncbi:MAG: CsbD family protein [Candidatus Sulfotelmatobacter sp.]
MNKDQVEGKVKDVAGRIERQAGEWTGDKEKEVDGTLKQVEGKLQNAWGNAKNAGRRAADKKTDQDREPSDRSVETDVTIDEEDIRARRNVS